MTIFQEFVWCYSNKYVVQTLELMQKKMEFADNIVEHYHFSKYLSTEIHC